MSEFADDGKIADSELCPILIAKLIFMVHWTNIELDAKDNYYFTFISMNAYCSKI